MLKAGTIADVAAGGSEEPGFEVSVTPPRGLALSDELIGRYRRAGVDRLVIQPPDLSTVAAVEAFVRSTPWC